MQVVTRLQGRPAHTPCPLARPLPLSSVFRTRSFFSRGFRPACNQTPLLHLDTMRPAHPLESPPRRPTAGVEPQVLRPEGPKEINLDCYAFYKCPLGLVRITVESFWRGDIPFRDQVVLIIYTEGMTKLPGLAPLKVRRLHGQEGKGRRHTRLWFFYYWRHRAMKLLLRCLHGLRCFSVILSQQSVGRVGPKITEYDMADLACPCEDVSLPRCVFPILRSSILM